MNNNKCCYGVKAHKAAHVIASFRDKWAELLIKYISEVQKGAWQGRGQRVIEMNQIVPLISKSHSQIDDMSWSGSLF